MTVNIPSSSNRNKPSVENLSPKAKIKNIYKIVTLGYPPCLFIRADKPQRGGGRQGRFRRVKEFFIDKENRIFVCYSTDDPDDPGYQFLRYAAIGRLIIEPEQSKEEVLI